MGRRGVAYRQILEHYFPGAVEKRGGEGVTGRGGEAEWRGRGEEEKRRGGEGATRRRGEGEEEYRLRPIVLGGPRVTPKR